MKKVLLLMLALAVAGCNDLREVEDELNEGGFALWYPAESGIEPGQIWITNGKQKHIQQRRPDRLALFGPNPAKFKTLTKVVNADVSLDASFAEGTLGGAGELAALLKSATVEGVKIDFGDTRVTRLVLGDLSNPQVTKDLPEGYLDDLKNVRTRQGYALVSGIVTSSGMTFTFTCKDTKQLEAKLPEINKLMKGEFKLNITSDKTAKWEIPETSVLAIGTSLVSGKSPRDVREGTRSEAADAESVLLMLRNVPLERLLEAGP